MSNEELQTLAKAFELWFTQGDNAYTDFDQLGEACEAFCNMLGFGCYWNDVYQFVN